MCCPGKVHPICAAAPHPAAMGPQASEDPISCHHSTECCQSSLKIPSIPTSLVCNCHAMTIKTKERWLTLINLIAVFFYQH